MPRQFKVTVNGREYDVSVLEVTAGQPVPSSTPAATMAAPAAGSSHAASAAAPAAAPAAAAAAAGDGDVIAGMGGVVVEVNVKVGQAVAVGDRLIVLEAMKMKTPVMATRAGQVTRVLVAAGDPIEGGQPLLTIA
ncbi:MAG TPA: acetyl-CoA carboxylase biotin carboxyl carrier protein subunit [Accumulibacter sp.]|uniref:biotin/lipoyl-containing protein n=1 Tax=Accumulibacter sp. TaxID=2053492 RepID=UPI002C30F90D|nr:biotin/lipoyl-containing protein [Accumulibacter sp.]HRD94606.1 acetyl-CoA carboxylase biotin carboxyl carrier protein subunit [Accumulibacter sp.]HRF71546.1 acetyl-CoA carboxylase biotin carboxyl carrier protein subunit [Accumulibacter sp.]